jgi:N-acetylglucosamine-6-phosphate deacetylase
VALVSDAVAVMGTEAGHARLGGRQVAIDTMGLARRADGTIAGSTLRLDQAVRNAVSCGVAPETALAAVTRTPADLLGRTDLGRLEPGAAADLVWWSDNLTVREVWLSGARTPYSPPARDVPDKSEAPGDGGCW